MVKNNRKVINFAYNANGYVNQDLDKGIKNITYNYLNLPEKITFGGGNEIIYLYDALGVKRRVVTKVNRDDQYNPLSTTGDIEEEYFEFEYYNTDYANNYIYQQEDMERTILIPNGYIYSNAPNVNQYKYYIKDHLGSVRMVNDYDFYTMEQVNHYYPFGSLTGESYGHSSPYKYNGKEQQKDHRLNWYDYGARMYSATEGIWKGPDPLAEKYYSVSPYAYCGNNPMNRIDPDGRADFSVNGKVIGNDGIDDQRILAVRTEALTKAEVKETTKFIKSNSGKSEAFQNNGMAYTNSIAIESSADNRQAMVTEVSRDNGKGGTAEANNREYGGSIQNGVVTTATPGAVANPKTDATASIELPTGVSTFHSHPSGTVVDSPPANTLGGTTTTYSFTQTPSQTDINNAGTSTNYVFGRSSGNVYIYNSNGVQAVIPIKQFVTPKR